MAGFTKSAVEDSDALAVAVKKHCQSKLDAVNAQLDAVWCGLLQQVAQAEFVATVAEAIKTRSVLRLIDATLRLNSAGTPISALLQRLAFQASVLEEAGLVWKSIMDAVLERKAEDVELWAEQAKLAGENVEMELAFAQSLRQAEESSMHSFSKASTCSDTSLTEVGVDEGDEVRTTATRPSRPSWRATKVNIASKDNLKGKVPEFDSFLFQESDSAEVPPEAAQSWESSTTHPHSPPESASPDLSPQPSWRRAEEFRPDAPRARPPAPYRAAGVDLDHPVFQASHGAGTAERPTGMKGASSTPTFAAASMFPRFAAYEAQFHKAEDGQAPRPRQRPSSAPGLRTSASFTAEKRSSAEPLRQPGPEVTRPSSAHGPTSGTRNSHKPPPHTPSANLSPSWVQRWKTWMRFAGTIPGEEELRAGSKRSQSSASSQPRSRADSGASGASSMPASWWSRRSEFHERTQDTWDRPRPGQREKPTQAQAKAKPSFERRDSFDESMPRSRGSRSKESSNTAGSRPPLLKADMREKHLALLGFPASAKPSPEELKKAYRAMAMRWHPDRPHNREKASEATANFKAAKAAYDSLRV